MNGEVYRIGLWVLTVGGLIPLVVFFLLYRPTRRWSMASLDTSGLLYVLGVLYLRSLVGLALGSPRTPRSALVGWFLLALGAFASALLWLRLLHFISVARRSRTRHARSLAP